MHALSGKIRHLYYDRKKSYEEIAELLGIGVDDVTKSLFEDTFTNHNEDDSNNILQFPKTKIKPEDCDALSLLGFIVFYNNLEDIKKGLDLDDIESVKTLVIALHTMYNGITDSKLKDILAHRITMIMGLLISETNDESNR